MVNNFAIRKFCLGGHHSYHDAIVFSCDSVDPANDVIKVRVVFSHPTQPSMLPCNYFLSGNCRFDEQSCKFSHGEVVTLSSLKEYVEPDFSGLAEGSRKFSQSLSANDGSSLN